MDAMWALVIFLPLLAWAGVLRARAAETRVAAGQMAYSTRLLRAHEEALEELLAHPDASDAVKRLAMDLSDAFEKRLYMMQVAHILTHDCVTGARPPERVVLLDELKEKHPVVHRIFMLATIQGMLSGLLRFPETYHLLGTATVSLVAAPDREIRMAAGAMPAADRAAYA